MRISDWSSDVCSSGPAVSDSGVAVDSKIKRRFLPPRKAIKRAVLSLGLAAGMVAAAGYGYRYWTTGQYLVSTDDAYVTTDYTTIAPKLSGYVAEVLVEDNVQVKDGQVIASSEHRASIGRARG